MKTSETQIELVKALFAARQKFPLIDKNKEGQAGNRKFKYAPLEHIRDQTEPMLVANGLMITQGTEGHVLVTRLDHTSGEWRETRMPVNEEHANMQSYGIEITYRRRYAYNLILGIVTEEDTDGVGGRRRGRGADFIDDGERNANGTAKGPRHKPTDGAGDGMTDVRKSAIEDLAGSMIEAHEAGRDMVAIGAYYDTKNFEDNDERVYLWSLLGPHSKLRSIIKANQPASKE